MRGEDSQSRMVALHRKGRGVAPSRSTRRSIHWRLSFAVAAFVLIALTFTLTAGNSKPHKTAAFTLAAEPESTLTAITDTSQQQFSNQLTDVVVRRERFHRRSRVDHQRDGDRRQRHERRDGQPRVPGNDRAERGQRCRPGDLRLLRFGYRGRHVHRAGLQVRQPRDALHAGGRAVPVHRHLLRCRRLGAESVRAARLDDEPGDGDARGELRQLEREVRARRRLSIRSAPRASLCSPSIATGRSGSPAPGASPRTSPSSTGRRTTVRSSISSRRSARVRTRLPAAATPTSPTTTRATSTSPISKARSTSSVCRSRTTTG